MQRTTAEISGGVGAAVIATVAFFAWHAGAEHWASSLPGHTLGVLGLVLMLWAGFGYSWRKRHSVAGSGTMQAAMQSHIIAGLVGPYLVILHSNLAFHGLAGVLSLFMVLVVASGVVGRAIMSAVPVRIELADPVRSAMLDAELARLETLEADMARAGSADAERRDAIKNEMISIRHEQTLQRTAWKHSGGGATIRQIFSIWWYLHVPISAALWVMAAAHVAGTLYYATFSR